MKKLLILLFSIFIQTTMVLASEIPVYVDGEQLEFDVAPQIMNERTMVPLRYIFEKFGATVAYEEETRAVMAGFTNAEGQESLVFMLIDNPNAFVNSSAVTLDSPPVVIDGRTLVPLRFIGETLGYEVIWNEAESAVYITSVTAP